MIFPKRRPGGIVPGSPISILLQTMGESRGVCYLNITQAYLNHHSTLNSQLSLLAKKNS